MLAVGTRAKHRKENLSTAKINFLIEVVFGMSHFCTVEGSVDASSILMYNVWSMVHVATVRRLPGIMQDSDF